MSFYLSYRWLTAIDGLTLIDRNVYMALDDRQGNNGAAWPSAKQIAMDVGVSRRSVERSLANLEAMGLLERAGKQAGSHGVIRWKTVTTSATLSGVRDATSATQSGVPPTESRTTSDRESGVLQYEPLKEPKKGTKAEAPGDGGGDAGQSATSGKAKKKGKKKAKKKGGDRNPHADAFKTAYDDFFDLDYDWLKADFVQFARWRKKHSDITPEQFVGLARWCWDQGEYCPQASLTIKGLCSAWDRLAAKRQVSPRGGGNGKHGGPAHAVKAPPGKYKNKGITVRRSG